jgi:hypothetical protein
MDTTVDVMVEGMAIAFLHVASGGTWTSQTVDDRFGVRHKSVTVAFVSCGGRPKCPVRKKESDRVTEVTNNQSQAFSHCRFRPKL